VEERPLLCKTVVEPWMLFHGLTNMGKWGAGSGEKGEAPDRGAEQLNYGFESMLANSSRLRLGSVGKSWHWLVCLLAGAAGRSASCSIKASYAYTSTACSLVLPFALLPRMSN
jgi:hypothetical protein